MVRKPDLKRLLSKGLSGKEAGKLVVEHAYAIDRGQDGFLSDRDIQSLKSGLESTEDIRDYNRYVDLYRAVYMTIQEARIASLEVEKDLRSVESQLDGYLVSQGVSDVYRWLPAVVTENDYQAMKARQKRRLRKRLYCLGEVLERRTEERLGGSSKAEDASEAEWDKAWQAADQEVQKLIDAGKLKPLRLGHRADLIAYAEAKTALEDPLELEDLAEDGEPEQETKDHHAAYLARLEEAVAQGDLSEGHDVSRYSGTLDEGDDEERLLYHYLSGDQLYRAGLPEWKRWIDEFKFYEEPELEEQEGGVAVIREDGFGISADPKGHYRNPWLDQLRDYAQVKALEEHLVKKRGVSMEDLLRATLRNARDRARVLTSYRQVLQEASEVSGVDFALEEVLSLSDVREAAEQYNGAAKRVSRWRGAIRGPRLPALELDTLKPDKATVSILRRRFALGVYGDGLGADWWKAASRG